MSLFCLCELPGTTNWDHGSSQLASHRRRLTGGPSFLVTPPVLSDHADPSKVDEAEEYFALQARN